MSTTKVTKGEKGEKQATAMKTKMNAFITDFFKNNITDKNMLKRITAAWRSGETQEHLLSIFSEDKSKHKKSAYQIFLATKKAEGIDFSTAREEWSQIKDDPEAKKEYQDWADTENGTSSSDSGMPKKPRSAYNFFCQDKDIIAAIKEENPGIAPKDLMVKKSEIWKSLDSDDKQQYDQMAAEDKERYKEEMENVSEEAKGKAKASVKRGKSGYNFFCKDKRAEVKEENPDLDHLEITRLLAEMWKNLKTEDETEYNKYKEMEAEEKERVATSSEVSESKPKRVTAWNLFCKDYRKQAEVETGEKGIVVTKRLKEMWDELNSDEDRSEELKEYKKLAAEASGKAEGKVEVKKVIKKQVKKEEENEEEEEVKVEAPKKGKGLTMSSLVGKKGKK